MRSRPSGWSSDGVHPTVDQAVAAASAQRASPVIRQHRASSSALASSCKLCLARTCPGRPDSSRERTSVRERGADDWQPLGTSLTPCRVGWSLRCSTRRFRVSSRTSLRECRDIQSCTSPFADWYRPVPEKCQAVIRTITLPTVPLICVPPLSSRIGSFQVRLFSLLSLDSPFRSPALSPPAIPAPRRAVPPQRLGCRQRR